MCFPITSGHMTILKHFGLQRGRFWQKCPDPKSNSEEKPGL